MLNWHPPTDNIIVTPIATSVVEQMGANFPLQPPFVPFHRATVHKDDQSCSANIQFLVLPLIRCPRAARLEWPYT
jgi:hypothetical protein